MNAVLRERLAAHAAEHARDRPASVQAALNDGMRRLRRRLFVSYATVSAVVLALALVAAAVHTSRRSDHHAATALTAISVTPFLGSVALGGSQQLSAVGSYGDGSRRDISAEVSWASSAPDVASVDAAGLARGHRPGSATVSASADGRQGKALITVRQAVLSSITVEPLSARLRPTEKRNLTALGTYADGQTRDLTSTVTWSSSRSSIAKVDGTGMIQAGRPGIATVTASMDGHEGSSRITVVRASLTAITVTPTLVTLRQTESRRLTAVGTYADGTTEDLTSQVQWRSDSPNVARVDGAGLLIASATGRTRVRAVLDGTQGTAAITVFGATLTAVSVIPSRVRMADGETLQLSATGTYRDGSTQDITSIVTWSSADDSVAAVDAAGMMSALAPGTTEVTAATGGLETSAPVSVVPRQPALTSIEVTPSANADLCSPKQTVQLTATGTYSDGSTQDITTSVDWASDDAAVATVDSQGLLRGAGGTGQAVVTATRADAQGKASARCDAVP